MQFRRMPGQPPSLRGPAPAHPTVMILYRLKIDMRAKKVEKSEELVAARAEPKIVSLAPVPPEYVHETWFEHSDS
jgi:hypothetical protein